jgi:hypothetical protein
MLCFGLQMDLKMGVCKGYVTGMYAYKMVTLIGMMGQ